MVSTLIDLVKIYIQNTGTGAFTLGTAVEGFRGTEALTNGATYSYSIQQGGNWEYGRGSYLASSGTLTRGVLASSTGGSAIDLTQNAQLALVALAEDIFGLANGDIAAEAGAAAGEAAAAAAIEPINDHLEELDAAVADRIPYSEKAAVNGVATLDSGGKIPTAQLPDGIVGGLSYQGIWNAATNTPTIPAASGGNKGNYYKVGTAGSTNIDGITDWQVGDWIVSNGTAWDKIDNSNSVSSVAGLVGVITASALKSALSLGNVDNTSDANKPVSTAQQAALDLKASLSGATFTGAVSISSGSLPFQVTRSGALDSYDELAKFTKPNLAGSSLFVVEHISPNVMGLEARDGSNTKGELRLQPFGGTVTIPFAQPYSGAVDVKVAGALQQNLPTAREFGAAVNGSTDTRAALLLADASGPFRLTKGLYYVASNTTLNSKVVFEPGARLVIPNGVTVTFGSDIEAGDFQIFNFTGTGNVANLKVARESWFVGDLIGTTTDATALMQKINGATNTAAFVFLHQGELCITGASVVFMTKGQNLVGAGMWGQTRYRWTTSARYGIQFNTGNGGSISGCHFAPHSSQDAVIATKGQAIAFTSGAAINFTVSDVFIQACFVGVMLNVGNTGSVHNVIVGDAIYSGFWTRQCYNVRFSDCHSSAFSDWAVLSTTAGFIAGESITWSGGNGAWGFGLSGTVAKIFINSTTPANGTTITGATSGATATVTSITKGHQSGAVNIDGGLEANDFIGCSFAGGTYPVYGRATADAHGSRPEFCRFIGCYFDNTDGGVNLQYCDSFIFVGCWFATRAGSGMILLSCRGTQVTACQFINSWHHGLYADPGSFSLMVSGCAISGNNKSNTGCDGINIAAGLTDFNITGNRIGGSWLANGGTHRYNVRVETGASDRYIIANNTVGGGYRSGAVSDAGTGTNKSVTANF